jgi:hypothetical protein
MMVDSVAAKGTQEERTHPWERRWGGGSEDSKAEGSVTACQTGKGGVQGHEAVLYVLHVLDQWKGKAQF